MADLSITPANIQFAAGSQKGPSNFLSGEAILAGDPLLLVDNVWMVADANDGSLMPATHMAANSTPGAGQPVAVFATGLFALGAHGLGNGIPMFMSSNVGKFCPLADVSTGNQTQFMFITVDSTHAFFQPVGGTVAHA